MFYLIVEGKEPKLHFPVGGFYRKLVNFDVERLVEQLKELGFSLSGKYQEPRIYLRSHNDQSFFDTLFELVKRTADELEQTLTQD